MHRLQFLYVLTSGLAFGKRFLSGMPTGIAAIVLSAGACSVPLIGLQAHPLPEGSIQVRHDMAELRPLSVAFTMMDEGTVGNIYGKRINRDFFVIHAAFSNNLGRSESGVSALAYSDSMYVRVRLEKRSGQSLNDRNRDPSGAWTAATYTDFGGAVIYDTHALPPLAPEANPVDRADYPLPDSFQIQPLSFSEMIKEAFDSKKGRLTDVQIQNITLETVRPIEELPYGGTVTRALFFPRRPFLRPGKDYVFRISEIYTGHFHTMTPVVHNRDVGPRNTQK